jgi:hypothetical protein
MTVSLKPGSVPVSGTASQLMVRKPLVVAALAPLLAPPTAASKAVNAALALPAVVAVLLPPTPEKAVVPPVAPAPGTRAASATVAVLACTALRLPNRPSASPLMPAVKKSVPELPAVPLLPKLNPHRPSMAIGVPVASASWPASAPVLMLKALMWPSPKLPISRSPAKVPKVDGATARPHGELSGPCAANCLMKCPLVS